MMKVGIISDIHNNVIALSAVLDVFKQENCEKIICAGDIISIGLYPEETIKKLMSVSGIMAVRGNHERYLLSGKYPSDMPEEEISFCKWEKSLISKNSYDFLNCLPNRLDIVIENVKITVLHYAMDEKLEYLPFLYNRDINDCHNLFKNINSDVNIYGHDHRRAINRDDKTLYINCGSLGCPSKDRNIARGGILNINDKKIDFKAIDVIYDASIVINKINELNYPSASLIKDVFFNNN